MKKTKESKINVLKSLNNTSVLSVKQQQKIKGGSDSEVAVQEIELAVESWTQDYSA